MFMFCAMTETSATHLRRLAVADLSDRLTAPPRQQRGRDRQRALIEAGLQLTSARDWADVTVGDIAAAIGCSVGTFYTRFHNKDAYFDVLLGLVTELMQQRADAFYADPARESETAAQFITNWVALVLQRSHEVGAAEAMVQQRRAEAARARAERMPDPVVGIRVLNERGGRERALGLTLSIPLGGSYRGAVAAAAGADALAAEARLSMVRREAKHDVQLAVAMARSLHGIWQQQKVARTAAEASASKAERAYALGESSLTDVLAARRVVQETALAERRASIDAVEAVARVEVDAHELWHRHEGADDDAAPSLPSLDY